MKKTCIVFLIVLFFVFSNNSIIISSDDLGVSNGFFENNDLWAVFVTVGEPKLDDKNAGDLYDILLNNGWLESNIYYLRENNATKEAVLSISDWLNLHGVESDDLVLFYFSMHGGKIGDVPPLDELDNLDEFIVPYKLEDGSDDNILDEELALMFDAIETEKLVIIFESCYSGGMIDGFNDLKKNGRIVITSTDVNETSYPFSLFFSRNGFLFGYYVVKSFSGDGDMNFDGYISAEEVYDYARFYTIRRSTFYGFLLVLLHRSLFIQHPQMYDGWPSEENNIEELRLISLS
jgi:hypothetical protein